jgi:hypothetical protein
MPGLTLTTMTVPVPPISLARVSAATTPPLRLSEAIFDTEMLASLTCVSTSTTLMPAAAICFMGWTSASTSVGAIRTASGCWAVTELTTGIWVGASKWLGPVNW